MKEKLTKCNKHYRSLFGYKLTPPIIQTKPLAAVTAAALLLLLYIIAARDGGSPLVNMKKTKPSNDDVVFEYPLDCAAWNETNRCPRNYPASSPPSNHNPGGGVSGTCPEYFRWIHEDLKPWKETGITREMVEKARRSAHFRLVVSGGRMYVERYRKSIQSRALFTMWGMVQLLRWFPGKLPDLELMFDCDDRPVVRVKDYRSPNSGPPPVFRYCSDGRSLDIVFPDWSFWGWTETNIKPWRSVTKDIKEGNKKRKWKDRVPLAYWKGNPHVTPSRADLMKCNLTRRHNFNTLLYVQDWNKEARRGYTQSSLANQCTHRYKIYIEGWAWSVSEKYIMACDSPTLYIASRFHDFFIRGMLPLRHYWPINKTSKCKSLQFAVHWGNNNNHTHQAEAIGEAGSKFIHEDMKMEKIYDFMFHSLNEYAKLLRFKPVIPPNAVELCAEALACPTNGVWREFMDESLEKSPSYTHHHHHPCTLPPPYDPQELEAFLGQKMEATKQVETWEKEYWDNRFKS